MVVNQETQRSGLNLGLIACVLGCLCFWAAIAYFVVALSP
jgi:fucose permease